MAPLGLALITVLITVLLHPARTMDLILQTSPLLRMGRLHPRAFLTCMGRLLQARIAYLVCQVNALVLLAVPKMVRLHIRTMDIHC